MSSDLERDNARARDMFTGNGVRRGVQAAIPMGIGVAVYGVVFGLLARQVGLSFAENLLMNVAVFAGAAQIASLDMWSYPLPIMSIVATTLLINLRLILLGAAARPWLRELPERKVYPMLHIMVDEGWAVAMNARRRGERDIGFFLGANLFVALCWLPSVVIGHLAGGGVGDPAAVGLDFAFTTIFAATLFSGYRTRFDLVPWGAAGAAALLAWWLLPGTWYVLVGGITGFLIGFAFGKPALASGPMIDGAP
ncbi:MAG: AzlC family ABC transporter permease [Chloroflexia bacterium]|nr:AzlC family ABC transporter permease [Chloroflexia bacterium]